MTLDELLPIREEFAKKASEYTNRKGSDWNSFGGFVLSDNTYFHVGKWVCHGWLSEYNLEHYVPNRGKVHKTGIKYVLSAVMHNWTSTDEQLNKFIDWLVNRSPWAVVFVDKDVQRIRELGYVVDANHPSSFIGSAMVASRFMTESYSGDNWKWRCDVYQELLAIGCTENEAFMFAHMYNKETAGKLYPITFSRLSAGHSTFYGCNYQENYVRSFLEGKPANFGGNVLASGKGYEGDTLNKTWGKTTGSDAFAKKVQALLPVSKRIKKDLHIFRKAPSTSYSYKDREDFASVIQQLRGLIYA